MPDPQSPAEVASQRALDAMFRSLDAGEHFRLEAGAGAGKTYSLIKALHYLIERHKSTFPRKTSRLRALHLPMWPAMKLPPVLTEAQWCTATPIMPSVGH